MTQNNIKIAITGGIGSGKSSVCAFIRESGYPVLSCDEIYEKLLLKPEFINKLGNEFGKEIISSEGSLNRSALSEIVFNNQSKLDKLNEITHAEIMKCALSEADKLPVCFVEVPLLFENGFQDLFNGVIVVLRDRELRINSVMLRNSLSREDVILRIKTQIDYEIYDFSKYYVIHNNANLQELRKKTIEAIIHFLKD